MTKMKMSIMTRMNRDKIKMMRMIKNKMNVMKMMMIKKSMIRIRKRMMRSNKFRFIINNIISIRKIDRMDTSRTSLFSMTISTLISTFTTTTITLISTFNLNLTLFEPHPTPPSHSPRTLQCPLSSPYPLSPHSIPLVTSNFISITFCYESKSP